MQRTYIEQKRPENITFNQFYMNLISSKGLGGTKAVVGTLAFPREDKLFAAKVMKISNKTSEGHRVLTHHDLIRYSTALSAYLHGWLLEHPPEDLSPHSLISIYLGRTIDTVAAMLGVMGLGAGFHLLDDIQVDEQGQVMAADKIKQYLTSHKNKLTVRCILTTRDKWDDFAKIPDLDLKSIKPIFLDDIISYLWTHQETLCNSFKSKSQATQLAFLVYSSGTTAEPKGILIPHSGIVSRLLSHYSIFEEDGITMGPQDNVAVTSPLLFDASIAQMLLGLGCGGTVHVIDEPTRTDMLKLIKYIQDLKISTTILVASQWSHLDQHCTFYKLDPKTAFPNWRIILSTGEDFNTDLFERWLIPGDRLLGNAYGPTEQTFGICIRIIKNAGQRRGYREEAEDDLQPKMGVGKPFANTQLHIMKYGEDNFKGENASPVIIDSTTDLSTLNDVEGEIIAIDINPNIKFRAIAYVNSPKTQSRNFITIGGRQAYRTGDRAKIIDGELCIIGRYGARQVKKNGRLICLPQVEKTLTRYLRVGKFPVFSSVHIDFRKADEQLIAYLESDIKILFSPPEPKDLQGKVKILYAILPSETDQNFKELHVIHSAQKTTTFPIRCEDTLTLIKEYEKSLSESITTMTEKKRILLLKLATDIYPEIMKDNNELLFLELREYAEKSLHDYMIPSRWALTTIAKTSKADVKKRVDTAPLTILFRRSPGDTPQQDNGNKIQQCIKQAWCSVFSDDVTEKDINDNTRFNELGGDSARKSRMLLALEEGLHLEKIITKEEFGKNLRTDLYRKNRFCDYVQLVAYHRNQNALKPLLIMPFKGKDNGDYLFLFRSPFSMDEGGNNNLMQSLERQLKAAEVILPCEFMAEFQGATFDRLLRFLENEIIERHSQTNQARLILAGHSAGGMLAYRMAQRIAKNHKAINRITVILLDTPAASLAIKISNADYINHIEKCVSKTFKHASEKKSPYSNSAFTAQLPSHLKQENGTENDKIQNRLKIILEAENYLLANAPHIKALKILTMMNYCRAELQFIDENQQDEKICTLLMTSQEYRQKIKSHRLTEEESRFLLWNKCIIDKPPLSLAELNKHQDFVSSVTAINLVSGFISDFIRRGKILWPIKFVDNRRHNINSKNNVCYIKPKRINDKNNGPDLAQSIINLLSDGRLHSILLTGDAGMGKTQFALNLTKLLWQQFETTKYESDQDNNYVPIYIDLKLFYNSKKDPTKKTITQHIARFFARESKAITLRPEITKQETEVFFNTHNTIYIVDGCHEIDKDHLEGIFASCREGISGAKRHLIFTCREALIGINAKVGFADERIPIYTERHLLPWDDEQILLYLNHLAPQPHEENRPSTSLTAFNACKDVAGFSELVKTPLLMRMVAPKLPTIAQLLLNADNASDAMQAPSAHIHAYLFTEWLRNEEDKLLATGKFANLFVFLKKPYCIRIYSAIYSINLAIELCSRDPINTDRSKIYSGDFDESTTLNRELIKTHRHTIVYFNKILKHASHLLGAEETRLLKSHFLTFIENVNQHENQFNDPDLDALIKIIRACSLITASYGQVNKHKFIHKSIIEYITDVTTFSDLFYPGALTPEQITRRFLDTELNRLHIRNEPNMLHALSTEYKNHPEVVEDFLSKLYKIVQAAQPGKGLAIVASNAATIILSICPTFFSRKGKQNLANVEIPYTDFNNAICHHTIFYYSDLSNCWGENTDFYGSSFSHTKLSDSIKKTTIRLTTPIKKYAEPSNYLDFQYTNSSCFFITHDDPNGYAVEKKFLITQYSLDFHVIIKSWRVPEKSNSVSTAHIRFRWKGIEVIGTDGSHAYYKLEGYDSAGLTARNADAFPARERGVCCDGDLIHGNFMVQMNGRTVKQEDFTDKFVYSSLDLHYLNEPQIKIIYSLEFDQLPQVYVKKLRPISVSTTKKTITLLIKGTSIVLIIDTSLTTKGTTGDITAIKLSYHNSQARIFTRNLAQLQSEGYGVKTGKIPSMAIQVIDAFLLEESKSFYITANLIVEKAVLLIKTDLTTNNVTHSYISTSANQHSSVNYNYGFCTHYDTGNKCFIILSKTIDNIDLLSVLDENLQLLGIKYLGFHINRALFRPSTTPGHCDFIKGRSKKTPIVYSLNLKTFSLLYERNNYIKSSALECGDKIYCASQNIYTLELAILERANDTFITTFERKYHFNSAISSFYFLQAEKLLIINLSNTLVSEAIILPLNYITSKLHIINQDSYNENSDNKHVYDTNDILLLRTSNSEFNLVFKCSDEMSKKPLPIDVHPLTKYPNRSICDHQLVSFEVLRFIVISSQKLFLPASFKEISHTLSGIQNACRTPQTLLLPKAALPTESLAYFHPNIQNNETLLSQSKLSLKPIYETHLANSYNFGLMSEIRGLFGGISKFNRIYVSQEAEFCFRHPISARQISGHFSENISRPIANLAAKLQDSHFKYLMLSDLSKNSGLDTQPYLPLTIHPESCLTFRLSIITIHRDINQVLLVSSGDLDSRQAFLYFNEEPMKIHDHIARSERDPEWWNPNCFDCFDDYGPSLPDRHCPEFDFSLSKEKNGYFYLILHTNANKSPLYCYMLRLVSPSPIERVSYKTLEATVHIKLCLPSIENKGVFFVQESNDEPNQPNVLCFSSLECDHENLNHTILYSNDKAKIRSIEFTNDQESQILVTFNTMIYLFAIERSNKNVALRILWSKGNSHSNLSPACLLNAFGVPANLQKWARESIHDVRDNHPERPASNFRPFNKTSFFSPVEMIGDLPPPSPRSILTRSLSLAKSYHITVCRPRSNFLGKTLPAVILVEFAQDQLYSVLKYSYDPSTCAITYLNITNDREECRKITAKINFTYSSYTSNAIEELINWAMWVDTNFGPGMNKRNDLEHTWTQTILAELCLEEKESKLTKRNSLLANN
jgi:acyl-CoA synthetase (AMP-forming)/AMP-acid ligase II